MPPSFQNDLDEKYLFQLKQFEGLNIRKKRKSKKEKKPKLSVYPSSSKQSNSLEKYPFSKNMKKGNYEVRIINFKFRPFYQEIFKKTKEEFGEGLAFQTIVNGISPYSCKGSQFFWITNLRKYLPKNIKIPTLKDIESLSSKKFLELRENFLRYNYADFDEIVLRDRNPIYPKNIPILEDLILQTNKQNKLISPSCPLRISGLELVKDDNPKNKYGLLLKFGKDTKMINDERFAYSGDCSNKIKFGNETLELFSSDRDLARLYFAWGFLESTNSNLSISDNSGRVMLVEGERK